MTIVSSTDFKTQQDKYLELALNECVYIKQDNNLFIVTSVSGDDDDEDDYDDLALAKERRLNGEYTSADDFINDYNNRKTGV